MKSPFAVIGTVEERKRNPFLGARNIVRDPNERDPEKNIAYADAAHYALEVESFRFGNAREIGDYVAVDFLVLESDNPANPVGSRAAWMVQVRNDYFAQDMSKILACAMNKGYKDVGPVDGAAACSTAQPLTGKRLRATATHRKNKKKNPGKDGFAVQFDYYGSPPAVVPTAAPVSDDPRLAAWQAYLVAQGLPANTPPPFAV